MPPHLQTTCAAGCGCKAPDVSAQGVGVWLQVVVLLPASHTMPVLEEHSFPVPQTQVGEEPCGLEPSWGSQAQAVALHKHRYCLYPQSLDESVSVFKLADV